MVDENSFEQIHEIQEKDVKFAIVGKELKCPDNLEMIQNSNLKA